MSTAKKAGAVSSLFVDIAQKHWTVIPLTLAVSVST